jgi:cell division protein FtsB
MSNTVAQVRSRVPRFAESAVERARLTVVPRRRVRAPRMPFVALVSMVLLGGVVGLLLFNTSMQQAAFASTDLQQEADALAARQQTLQMDLDRLRDPQRIAAAAVKLHMVQAGNVAFLDMRTGKVEGDPSPGSALASFPIWPKAPAKPAALDPKPHVVWVDPPAPTRTGKGTPAGGPSSNPVTNPVTNPAGDTASATTGTASAAGRKNVSGAHQTH